jgi:murein DD-endopeptidase MepM/ murein hydrolase activator NlpD
MTHPIKGFSTKPYSTGSITQYFAESPELYSKAVCHEYCMHGHNGLDIVAPWGTPIFAIEGGVVAEVKNDAGGYGKHIRVLSEKNADTYREWTYGHLSRIDVVAGQVIAEGAQIGLMGNTGFVVSGATPYWEYNPYAGTHLHVTCREALKYKKGGTYSYQYADNGPKVTILNYNNGYFGAIDPLQFFIAPKKSQEVPQELLLTWQSILNQALLFFKSREG